MAGYLEAYGEAEARHARTMRFLKVGSVVLVAVLALGVLLFAVFRNFSEEQRVKSFLSLLEQRRYPEAYALWGCTPDHPCASYPLAKFMGDWGPNSPHAGRNAAHIGLSQNCGTGVLLRLDYQNGDPDSLWVEHNSKVISYAPWAECPGRHLHFGAWFHSLFS